MLSPLLKPTMICVLEASPSASRLTRAMVDAALHYPDLIPPSENGLVALIAARRLSA